MWWGYRRGGELCGRGTNEEVSCVVGVTDTAFYFILSVSSSCAVRKCPPLSTSRSGTVAESTSGEAGEVTGDMGG